MNNTTTMVLGVIIASGAVGDYDALRRSYLAIALIIILLISLEKYIRGISLYFDFMNTLLQPLNVGLGMHKIAKYSTFAHLLLLLLLAILELIISLAAIYCLTILVIIFGEHQAFVNYCVLSLIIIESSLGFFLYISASILLLTVPDFYAGWLNWVADENLPPSLDHEIYLDEYGILHMAFNYLGDGVIGSDGKV